MIKTFNILSLLLDYPSEELRASLDDVLPALRDEAVLGDDAIEGVGRFLDYARQFATLHDWQAAYSDLFDSSSKTTLYLFDMVYGTSKERGQAMVSLKEEYLKAGLMPSEEELPDYLPMYLQYVSNMDTTADARAAIDDISAVLKKMDQRFLKEQHPYEPLIGSLTNIQL